MKFFSSHNSIVTFLTGIAIFLFLLILFSDQLHLWPFFRRPTVFKYFASDFSDNIAARDLRGDLSSFLPIDVVYTWVNGSDPLLINRLSEIKRQLSIENDTSIGYNFSLVDTLNDRAQMNVALSPNGSCILRDCVPFNVLVLSYREGLAHALKNNEIFPTIPAERIEKVIQSCERVNVCPEVVTFVKMSDIQDVNVVLTENITFDGEVVPAVRSFVTSQKVINSIPLTNYYILSSNETNSSVLIDKLYSLSSPQVFSIVSTHDLYTISIVVYKVSESYNTELVTEAISTLYTLSAARIVWESLHDLETADVGTDLGDYSTNRFQDNEELRFSIRSVLKFAPWVRHIYIVTNGQIPYWLDLSNPRVTIVPHHDIFQNLSHLPTFSSPAIETHLHRIPGLSKKFLYMNDDVMFGQPVFPEDFYSKTKGQKIYLSWPVPNCNDGCPPSWIGDGYCDTACNNTDCERDGGDCNVTKSQERFSRWGFSGYHFTQDTRGYCAPGCPDSWLGDRYCDSSCFTIDCAFDSGDCGVDEFFRVHKFNYRETNIAQLLLLPLGAHSAYLNFSDFFPKEDNWTLISGFVHMSDTIRTSIFSRKYHVLSMTFFQSNLISISNSTVYMTFSKRGMSNVNSTLSFNISRVFAQSVDLNVFTTSYLLDSYEMVENTFLVNDDEFLFLSSPKDGKIFYDLVKQIFRLVFLSKLNFSSQMFDFFINSPQIPWSVRARCNLIISKYMEGLYTYDGFIHYLSVEINKLPIHSIQFINTSLHGLVSDIEVATNITNTLEKPQMYFSVPNRSQKPFVRRPLSKNSAKIAKNYPLYHGRNLLDTFGESLKYVNRKFSKRYGYEARKVPAHMPHLIDREVMQELQDAFNEEFDLTSSHQIRHNDDMQYSFSYFYFYMSETLDSISLRRVFEEIDADNNGILSILEHRNLLALLYNLPLSREVIDKYYEILNQCGVSYEGTLAQFPKGEFQSHYGDNLPLVNLEFFVECKELMELVKLHYSIKSKRHFEIMDEDDIAFKMINQNSSQALSHLDWIRKHRRRFICINDNIDHSVPSSLIVKSLIREFYISIFPIPSPFELPHHYQNRFTHFDEFLLWQFQKNSLDAFLKFVIFITLVSIFSLIFFDKFKRRFGLFNYILAKLCARKQKKYNYLV